MCFRDRDVMSLLFSYQFSNLLNDGGRVNLLTANLRQQLFIGNLAWGESSSDQVSYWRATLAEAYLLMLVVGGAW